MIGRDEIRVCDVCTKEFLPKREVKGTVDTLPE